MTGHERNEMRPSCVIGSAVGLCPPRSPFGFTRRVWLRRIGIAPEEVDGPTVRVLLAPNPVRRCQCACALDIRPVQALLASKVLHEPAPLLVSEPHEVADGVGVPRVVLRTFRISTWNVRCSVRHGSIRLFPSVDRVQVPDCAGAKHGNRFWEPSSVRELMHPLSRQSERLSKFVGPAESKLHFTNDSALA